MKIFRGTSIIEIVIAAALISMAVIAALSLANRSQKQNTYARNLDEATKYATQAVDWVRTQRSSLGWATLATKSSGIYCLNSFPASFSSLTVGACAVGNYIADTIFQRQITLDTSPLASGVIKININVTWLEQIIRQTQIDMELSKWN